MSIQYPPNATHVPLTHSSSCLVGSRSNIIRNRREPRPLFHYVHTIRNALSTHSMGENLSSQLRQKSCSFCSRQLLEHLIHALPSGISNGA